MDKSFVTIETAQCPVCGEVHETGSLFLDKRMEHRFEKTTCTGFALCKVHQRLIDEGYIILMGIADDGTDKPSRMKISEADRTGECVYVRRSLAEEMFDLPDGVHDIMFCDPQVIALLQKMQQGVDTHEPSELH